MYVFTDKKVTSYTSTKIGPLGRVGELVNLLLIHQKFTVESAGVVREQFSAIQGEIEALLGRQLVGLDVLEIGCGQRPFNLALWSRHNRAVGIDSELVIKELSLKTAINLVRTNGLARAVKSLGRRLLRVDQHIENAFKRATLLERLPELDIRLMDATALSLPDVGYDIVFSRAVFEHLADPRAVTREVRRVLRSNGVFYCLLHLYTSDSGCHDARIFSESPRRPPYWSHLRQQYASRVHSNTFLNRWALKQWQEMFGEELPGCRVFALNDDRSEVRRAALRSLRAAGELESYGDDELLSPTVKVIWKKPGER